MRKFLSFLVVLMMAAASSAAWAQDGKIGVVILHGKSGMPGSNLIVGLGTELEFDGVLVAIPEMPWSRNRMYDATFDQALDEIHRQVQALREKGARKVVVAGHSMGANAALGYAAYREGADGIIALAPGHTPELGKSRDSAAYSVSKAKELMAEGKGKESQQFDDLNQGKKSKVTATPEVYLSWFDPDGLAIMPKSATAIKRPIPLLVIEGSRETLAKGRSYFFTKAPEHPGSMFTTVDADHNGVPGESGKTIVAWMKALQ